VLALTRDIVVSGTQNFPYNQFLNAVHALSLRSDTRASCGIVVCLDLNSVTIFTNKTILFRALQLFYAQPCVAPAHGRHALLLLMVYTTV
jgi:hypothetical protein